MEFTRDINLQRRNMKFDVTFRSRSVEAHSLLSELSDEQKEQAEAILTRAVIAFEQLTEQELPKWCLEHP